MNTTRQAVTEFVNRYYRTERVTAAIRESKLEDFIATGEAAISHRDSSSGDAVKLVHMDGVIQVVTSTGGRSAGDDRRYYSEDGRVYA